MTMQNLANPNSTADRRSPWNKGKLTGAKPPLLIKHVWSIRTKLQIAGRTRDLAMFNLAIDSKLRGCDVVALKVEDVASSGYAVDRATVRQKKTGQPVRFELSEQTRQAVDDYLGARGITQLPFGVETVFPVGPLQYKVNRDTAKIEGASISERFVIINQNGKPVATTPFVDPVYASVSAVIGCASDRRYGKPLAIHVVHNPLASVPVHLGICGAQEDEWFATPAPDAPGEFDLTHS
jgi:hypothetical protein